jgi:hypothetical protein
VSRLKSTTIRKAVNACAELNKGEKRILAEVCTFVYFGKNGVCDATNQHFVTECLVVKDTVGRILARLESKGYLRIDLGKERGNQRLLWPTTKALALYLTPAEITAALASETAHEPAEDLSTKVDTPIDEIWEVLSTLVDTPIDFSGVDLSTFHGGAIDFLRDALLIVRERVIEREKERILASKAHANELAALRRRIAELEGHSIEQPTAEIPSPQSENTCGSTDLKGGAARYAPAEPDEEPIPAERSPLADPRLFGILVARAGYTGLDEHAYRLQMLATAQDQGLVMVVRRWSKWVAGYLNSDKRNNKLLLAPAPGTDGNRKGGRGLGDTRKKASVNGYTL